eukprot:s365_g17.t1
MALVPHVPRHSVPQLLHSILAADRQLCDVYRCLDMLVDVPDALGDIDCAAAIPLIDQSINVIRRAIFVVHVAKLQYHTRFQRQLRGQWTQWHEFPYVDLDLQ